VQTVTKAAAPVVQTVAQATAPVVQTVTQAAAPVVQTVTQAVAAARSVKASTGVSGRSASAGVSGAAGGSVLASTVPSGTASVSSGAIGAPRGADASAAGAVAPRATGGGVSRRGRVVNATGSQHSANAMSARRVSSIQSGSDTSPATDIVARGLDGLGSGSPFEAGAGRRPQEMTGTRGSASGSPAAVVRVGAGSGDGGGGATGGTGGGFSGAAEVSSYAIAGVAHVTLVLGTFAERRLAAPFLLLLERPG
jgi:hypothetical protein